MRFEVLEPGSIEEAVSLLTSYGEEARPIAGGTDLLVQIRYQKARPRYLVDLGSIPGLDYVRWHGDGALHLGALATLSAIASSPDVKSRFAPLAQAARLVGSVQVRNLATVAGNLCHASPSAETAPALLALGAVVEIQGPKGKRQVPLVDFFAGPGSTVLAPGELVVEIGVPNPGTGCRGVYLKHSLRAAMDIAMVGVAAVLSTTNGTCVEARLALGAVAPTPIRATAAEKTLVGKKLQEDVLEEVAREAAQEAHPIDDIRAPADYRREIVRVLVKRAVRQAWEAVA
ncbi:MAG: xanthine dehydrogenase family protein subunit M [Dehalococcoidia bacterium]|nr:xanthine dehydrogenase family protein subunit M [Dehalococcoidia bacterium]